MSKNFAPFIERRSQLYEAIKKAYPEKKGMLVIFAGFENERYAFRQDSSFYYLTGLIEPAVALMMNGQKQVLYVPQYGTSRSQWVSSIISAPPGQHNQWGINELRYLGAACKGYSLSQGCLSQEYDTFLTMLEEKVKEGEVVFTFYPRDTITNQTLMLDRLLAGRPHLKNALIDISPFVASMRRTKSQYELELIYEAVDCTMHAHEAVATRLEPDLYEYQLQAALEFIFTESGGTAAFPSIVAAGKNSTVLHYTQHDSLIKKGDLVIIDIGAELDYYCADITRTYPASGVFTTRQREVYSVVLETQEYIASIAQPGCWINNNAEPEKSLQHLARAFLKERGYDSYFNHGISHFLGLDVHDVGDYREPLKEGDVITIEPGIYIPEEQIGIRIEDNYWVTKNTVACLSEELPKDPYEIENMMANDLSED